MTEESIWGIFGVAAGWKREAAPLGVTEVFKCLTRDVTARHAKDSQTPAQTQLNHFRLTTNLRSTILPVFGADYAHFVIGNQG